MAYRRWFWILAACAGSACTNLTPPLVPRAPDSGPVVSVTKLQYHWSVDSAIAISVVNPSGDIAFVSCWPFRLQHYHNGWREVEQPGVGFVDGVCGIYPFARSDTLRRSIPLQNMYVPVSGWYRVVVDLYHDGAGDRPWPEANRISAPFEVAP